MIILLGKTCSGKDTIQKELIKLGMKSIVSYTTRPPRKGETDGVAYNFIDKETFLRLEQEGFFAETTSYNVATNETWYYGSAKKDLTDDKVIILNPEGLKALKNDESLNISSFYIEVKENILRRRLKKRGDNVEKSIRRIKADRRDFRKIYRDVDYIINNNGRQTPEEIAKTIKYFYDKQRGD